MKNKKVYYWGLVGIIPVFGILSGIILIMAGLLRYKDKMVVGIGIISIIVSAISFIWSFKYTSSDPRILKTFTSASRKNINGLVDDIEDYKRTKGGYPENLQQVLAFRKYTTIYDVLQTFRAKRNNHYYYQRINDRYKVFSSGIDAIPGTDDDIYPDIINYSDSIPFKYIKK